MVNKNSCVIRGHLAAGGVVASAGILALGLVVVTPDFHSARTEVHAVQLTTLRLEAAQMDALEKFIGNHAEAIRHVSEVVAGGAADIPATLLKTLDLGVSNPKTVDSVNDPAINSQSLEAAALAEPLAAVSLLDPILGIVVPILGLLLNPQALLLFAPIILLVVLACPPCALFNFVGGIISSFLIDLVPVAAVAAAPLATFEAKATDPTLTDEPVRNDVSSTAATTNPSADAPSGPKAKKSDESVTERATENEQTSTETATTSKKPTEIAKTEESTKGPSAATSEEAKPTPRPVVRRSLDASEPSSDLLHRGNGGRSATKASAIGDETTAVGSSSAAPSSASSTSGDSSDSDSSGGEASGS